MSTVARREQRLGEGGGESSGERVAMARQRRREDARDGVAKAAPRAARRRRSVSGGDLAKATTRRQRGQGRRRQWKSGNIVKQRHGEGGDAKSSQNTKLNPVALFFVLIGAQTLSLVHIASHPQHTALHMLRECMQARRLRHRPIAGEFRGAPP